MPKRKKAIIISFHEIHRRLTADEADNVWSFYKMVKAKLEMVPGDKPQ
jgi:hypothetical protein